MEDAHPSGIPRSCGAPADDVSAKPPIRRLVAFAHYDRDSIIDEYVVKYLRGLRQIADEIVFVSDCYLNDGELAKLQGLAKCVHAARHGEYDFGSWKRAIEFCGARLSEFDELILANDSCYGPAFPLDRIFAVMASRGFDFWGITQHELNRKGFRRHLQSYFLVLRKPVFTSEVFRVFLETISLQQSKRQVIELYELGLTAKLEEAGYAWGSWVEFRPGENPTCASDFMTRGLLCGSCPFVKVSLLRDNPYKVAHVHLWRLFFTDESMRRATESHITRISGEDDPACWHYVLPTFRFAPLGRYGPIVYAKNRKLWLWTLGLRLLGLTFVYVPIFLPRFLRTYFERRATQSMRSALRNRHLKTAGL